MILSLIRVSKGRPESHSVSKFETFAKKDWIFTKKIKPTQNFCVGFMILINSRLYLPACNVIGLCYVYVFLLYGSIGIAGKKHAHFIIYELHLHIRYF